MNKRIVSLLLSVSILLSLFGGTVPDALAEELDYSANVGKYATFNVAELPYFDFTADPATYTESIVFDASELSAELTVVITDWYVDDLEGIWYKIEAAPNNVLPEDIVQNPWVLDGYVGDELLSLLKFDAPDVDPSVPELGEVTEQGIAVGVTGAMPEGTQLFVQDVTVDPEEYGIADPSTILAAVDIRLLTSDGTEYQPYTNNTDVEVTIDADKLGLADGDVVRLHHNHEGRIAEYGPLVITDGKLTFYANQFSIYLVQSTTETTGTLVNDASTYTITLGEGSRIFYSPGIELDPGVYPVVPGKNGYNKFYVWSVTDTDGILDYTVYNTDLGYHWVGEDDYDARVAPWIKITPKRVGTATLTIKTSVQYWPDVTTGNGAQTGVYIGQETFTINVVEPTYFHIRNSIPESGCLVPRGFQDLEDVVYEWSRSDGKAVRPEALIDDSINVSIDHGGIYYDEQNKTTTDPVVYTVTAKQYGSVLGTASYEVLYGSNILNPSFEDPANAAENWLPNWGGNRQEYGYATNGTPGLYWKTTAPGDLHNLGRDLEFCKQGSPHGAVPADGEQYVELNAENIGTLYQDILTTPGASFTWSFRHSARVSTRNDNMYILMAAAEDAQSIANAAQINAIIAAARAAETEEREKNPDKYPVGSDINPIPKSGEGFAFTYNGKTYRIWNSWTNVTATTPEAWRVTSGEYEIPDGQYLTRLFFVSDPNSGNPREGNLIDAISSGETMNYTVEYYYADAGGSMRWLGCEQNAAHTYPLSSVSHSSPLLNALDTHLEKYIYPYSIEINGKPYPGTLEDLKKGLYITDYGNIPDSWTVPTDAPDNYLTNYSNVNIVLRLVFRDPNVVVVKRVELTDQDSMTHAEKVALIGNGLSYTFELCGQDGTAVADVADTTVTIEQLSSSGAIAGLSSFDLTASHKDKSYSVRETAASDIPGYQLVQTAYFGRDNQPLTGNFDLSASNNVQVVRVVNTYAPKGNLEIHKNVTAFPDNPAWIDSNKEFTFTLTLDMDGVHDQMKGPYPYTIKNSETLSTVSTGVISPSNGNTLTFTLKHNQYILIEDLPHTAYTLTEASAGDRYSAAYYFIGSDGPEATCESVIPKGKTEQVYCYNPVVISNGDLQITKRVDTADAEANVPPQAFHFTICLKNASNVADSYTVKYSCTAGTGTLSADQKTYTLDGQTFTLAQTVNTNEDLGDYFIELDLYDGLTATIENLPPCGYYVTEADYSAQKFGTTWEGETIGFIGGVKVNDQNPVVSLTCVNTYNVTTGVLKITKNVQKAYERDTLPDRTFQFTIVPKTNDILLTGSYTVNLTYGAVEESLEVAATPDNKLVVTIPFTEAELADLIVNDIRTKSITITGLPLGDYTVTEATDPDYVQSTTSQETRIGATASELVFTNKYKQHLGQITIKKHVTNTDEKVPVFVRITGGGVDMTVPVTPDVPVTIYDLPLDVTYTVAEITSWNWRYTAEGATSADATLTLNSPNHEILFRNSYEIDLWLSSTTVQQNTFTVSTDN